MYRLLVALALLAWVSPAAAADLATPTATAAAATPAPTPVLSQHGGIIVAKGTCRFNLPAIGVVPTPAPTPFTTFGFVPQTQFITCPVAGVRSTDIVLANLMLHNVGYPSEYEALRLNRCQVRASSQIECTIDYTGAAGIDPGDLTLQYVVVR